MDVIVLDPEFLRKRKCSVQKMTNFCDCNSTEVDGENSHDVIANEKLPVITKGAKKEYVSQDVVERCGDCKLDHCKFVFSLLTY